MTHTPTIDFELQELMERAFDSSVGIILESNDFSTLNAHLQQALRPLAEVIAAEGGGVTHDDVETVVRSLATQCAFDLWNTTPIPENHFRPRKIARPERNAPCPCGSQRKYKQCCGAISPPSLILPPDEMLARVLAHLPRERLGDIVALGAPVHVLGLVANRWCDEGRVEDVITLLEPLFADVSKLDERADVAAQTLMHSYLTLQRFAARDTLIARLKTSKNRALHSTALQREATICIDRGDTQGAWHAFREAQKLIPDDPTMGNLETLLLLAEGRREEAHACVEHWTAKLARDPDHDNRPMIQTLHALLDEGFQGLMFDNPLDKLPLEYPERRLVLHIALERIDPPIWRRMEVENTLTFADLHHLIQAAMGWENEHLHEFRVGDYRIGSNAGFGTPFDEDVLPGEEVELGQVIGRRKSFTYEYDFGDSWSHRITIEKRLPSEPQRKPAALIDGERACPPEDCGGVYGYYNILEAKRTPRSPESREVLQWLGPYEPETFKLAKHQKQIDAMFKRMR